MKHILFSILILCLFAGNSYAQIASDEFVKQYLQSTGIYTTQNNQINLLTSGHDKFVDLFEAIRKAKHHIHLEYFNFRNDSIANALFDLLAQKHKEGVKIRAMFDAFGNWSNNKPLKKHHIQTIRQRGIELVKFDPFAFPYINHAIHRDHRKIVVIDGKTAYTGGMNIADYYIHGLPKVGAWRDIHMRIEGEAVRQLQAIFLDMWNHETDQHIGGPEYFPPLQQWPDSMTQEIAIVDRTPRKTPHSIARAYATSIRAAENNIQIINPYFTPVKIIRKALKTALKKGTEVEIMIPSVSDIPFTPDVALHIAHKLMKKGARIYLYNGGFHHSKIMMVDNKFCTVGTANLNSRSLRYDYETNAFIFDSAITHQLNNLFEADKKNSTLMTPEFWKKRSAWKKFVGWFGNLLTPFL